MTCLLRLFTIGAVILAAPLPSFAQIQKMPNGVLCAPCTQQCTACGLGEKCKATCVSNGNGRVKYGKTYCTSWFAGCNGGN